MLMLTNSPERLHRLSLLVSFGITITLLAAIVTWLLRGPVAVVTLAILLITILLVVVEFVRRNSTIQLYNFCNVLLKHYSLFLQKWINNVCFYVIITSIGAFGKDRHFNEPGQGASMWHIRFTLHKDTYNGQYNKSSTGKTGTGSWIGNYVRWSLSTKNVWMIFLLPFLILLKIHKVEEEKKFPTNIYTLY